MRFCNKIYLLETVVVHELSMRKILEQFSIECKVRSEVVTLCNTAVRHLQISGDVRPLVTVFFVFMQKR